MAFLITALLVHLLLLINLRFEAWPEIIIYPWLMDNGFKLYQDIINPYLPGLTWFLYLFFRVFGFTLLNWQLLTWGIILATDLLIYFIARRRYGQVNALIALGFFILFQPLLDGNGLWFDLATTPILLLAFYFNSPLLLAVSFFIKQSVVWLFPLFLKSWKHLLISLFILFAISSLPFASNQTLSDYFFWPWRFTLTILPTMPGHKDWGTPGLWIIALTPFLPLLFFRKNKPFYWTILSFLFVLPRFGLFHLQPALAFASLVVAQNTTVLFKLLHSYTFKLFAIGYLLLASLLWLRHIRLYWHQPPRFFEPEILQAAETLKNLTPPDQPLLWLNAPNQLMVLADRLPTKPWAITFPWYLELPGMQQRFIQAVTSQSVASVVFSPYQFQGRFTPGSYRPIDLDNFVKANFTQEVELTDDIYLLSRP